MENSSPGHDIITIRDILFSEDVIAPIKTNLLNSAMENAVLPDILEKTIVIPIHKDGDKSTLNNYRPISLIPVFCKIFEKPFNERTYQVY